jgi:hypothetical protein
MDPMSSGLYMPARAGAMNGSMNQDLTRRIEQKYLFPAGYTDVIRTWLEHACVPDPRHPSDVVSSIYFDTPGLFHFHESRNGEFLRAKIRLRWYGGSNGDPVTIEPFAGVRCYLEVKFKQGVLSEKKRAEVAIPRQVLVGDPFFDSRILDLAERAYELGYRAAGILTPILLIRYQRRRYLDPGSDTVLSLDGEIRCTRVNDRVFQATPPVYLDVGVLEVKGMERQTGEILLPIGAYLRKSPFSKYVVSVESLMQPLGRRV